MSAFSKFNILLASFGVFLLFSQTASAGFIIQRPNYTGLNSGLVGYWSFDGKDMAGVKAYDRSGQGNTGTLTNGPVRVQGKIGQALSFDGANDYINVGAASNIPTGSSQRTLTFWFNTNSFGLDLERRLLSLYDVNGVVGTLLVLQAENNAVSVGFNGHRRITPAGALSTKNWYFVSVVIPPGASLTSDAKVYIDGVQQTLSDEAGSAQTLNSGTVDVKFATADVSGDFLDGKMDDVRIYNRALSADEIKRLYKIGGTLKINTSINNTSLQNGLVGYWSFDGPTVTNTNNAIDISGQGNHGTLTNGPTRAIGKIGQALSFDGVDDYATTTSNINLPSSMTFAFWINPPSSGAGTWRGIIGANSNDRAIFLNNTEKFGVINDVVNVVTSLASILENQWTHGVYTWDGTNSRIYINGVLDNTSVNAPFTNVAVIGTDRADTLDETFEGKIDDVRVYNRALLADEIKRLYRIGATLHINTQINNDTLNKGLVGYWTFDGKDMNATKALDISGQGNHGTLTNGPTRAIGKIGQALSFDGVDDYATTTSNINLPSSMTFAFWINPPSSGAGTWRGIIGANSNDRAIFLNNTEKFGVINDVVNVVTSLASILENQWTHGVYTWDGTNSRIYINGVLDNTSVNAPFTNVAVIGTDRADTLDETFEGKIDDVRIYNRALLADEIKRLYNLGR